MAAVFIGILAKFWLLFQLRSCFLCGDTDDFVTRENFLSFPEFALIRFANINLRVFYKIRNNLGLTSVKRNH